MRGYLWRNRHNLWRKAKKKRAYPFTKQRMRSFYVRRFQLDPQGQKKSDQGDHKGSFTKGHILVDFLKFHEVALFFRDPLHSEVGIKAQDTDSNGDGSGDK